jgi:hypothetical protein
MLVSARARLKPPTQVTLLSPQLNQNKLTNYNYNTYMLPTTNVSQPGT